MKHMFECVFILSEALGIVQVFDEQLFEKSLGQVGVTEHGIGPIRMA